jgi:hypothetical protein
MDASLPTFTALDAITQGIAGLLYLVIGVSAWLYARGDTRTQVFLGVALANVVAFALPTAAWLSGAGDLTSLPRAAVATVVSALGLGSVLLFHFSQVFPRRRPWIARHWTKFAVAYGVVPLVIGGLILLAPSDITDLSLAFVIPAVLLGLPCLILIAFVLPIAGIISLVKSFREAVGDLAPMRTPLLWLLVSQIAGGTIALLFAPVLATIAPNSTAQTAATLAVWLLGLMTPIAFALAVWRYGLPLEDQA